MRVKKVLDDGGEPRFELLGDDGQPIAVVADFLRQLHARGYSPNTLSAYAHDLLHFFRFLARKEKSTRPSRQPTRRPSSSTCARCPAAGRRTA